MYTLLLLGTACVVTDSRQQMPPSVVLFSSDAGPSVPRDPGKTGPAKMSRVRARSNARRAWLGSCGMRLDCCRYWINLLKSVQASATCTIPVKYGVTCQLTRDWQRKTPIRTNVMSQTLSGAVKRAELQAHFHFLQTLQVMLGYQPLTDRPS